MQLCARRSIKIPEEASIMDERRRNVNRLKRLVARGDYAVDPQVIADAVLARWRLTQSIDIEQLGSGVFGDCGVQTECSYPRIDEASASAKRTHGFPARTRPIQLNRSSQLRAAASATVRALGGTQTQSS
jgi:hypothetical protein